MSHNVTLSGIKFSSLDVLKRAFLELQGSSEHAKSYEFVGEPTTVRGWAGRTSRVDAAIKCPREPYDIGLRKTAEGEYVPFMEHGFCAQGLSTEMGAKSVDGQSCRVDHHSMALGRLQQRYAILTAEDNARRQNLMTRRISAADGQIQLEVISR